MQQWSNDLLEALKRGEVNRLKTALKEGEIKPDGVTEDRLPVMMLAVYYGQKEVIGLLLENGCPLDGFAAAALGDLEALTAWINAHEDAQSVLLKRSVDGWSLLHLAAFFGQMEVVRWLIRHHAPVDLISENNQVNQPLHAAIAARQPQIAMELVQAGAPLDHDANGFTPLLLAIANEMTELVSYLIEHGADPAKPSSTGLTAWELAETHESDEIRNQLRASGNGIH